MKTRLLQDKVALITGAAGAIGSAVARGFAAEGAKLCLVDIDVGRLTSVVHNVRSIYGDDVLLNFIADVRDSNRVRNCVEEAISHFGRLDILVNNAAVTQIRKIDEVKDRDIDEIIDTNLKAYFYYVREFVRWAKKNKTLGTILMISSKNGLEGAAEKSLYSAAKGGEITMARALARELGPFGIRVNTICPDAVHEGSKLWKRGGRL